MSDNPPTDLSLEAFLALPTEEASAWVRSHAPAFSVALPVNGTRRWWYLQADLSQLQDEDKALQAYMQDTQVQQINIFKRIFEHGVTGIVAPIIGGRPIERRDEKYKRAAMAALGHPVDTPEALAFYHQEHVAVRFYGDYEQVFRENDMTSLIDRFADLTEKTAQYTDHCLLYGLWANDTTSVAATQSVAFFQTHGRIPTEAEMIQSYYGMDVPPIRLYIGGAKFKIYDVPLFNVRRMALYANESPTIALTQTALRKMLYDAVHARLVPERNPITMNSAQRERLRHYFTVKSDFVLGAGDFDADLGYWAPEVAPRA